MKWRELLHPCLLLFLNTLSENKKLYRNKRIYIFTKKRDIIDRFMERTLQYIMQIITTQDQSQCKASRQRRNEYNKLLNNLIIVRGMHTNTWAIIYYYYQYQKKQQQQQLMCHIIYDDKCMNWRCDGKKCKSINIVYWVYQEILIKKNCEKIQLNLHFYECKCFLPV